MVKLLSENVDLFVLAAFVLGGMLVLWEDMEAAVKKVVLRRSLARRKRSRKKQTALQVHLGDLFQLLPRKWRMEPEVFVAVSVAAAVFVMYMTVRPLPAGMCLVFSVAAGFMPYGLLRLRCEIARSKVSGEGTKMLSILLSAYRMNGGNISEALEFTAAQKKEIPETSPVLQQMVMRLRESE
ncbi:MAG: hypothetical protein IKV96_02975, partial [Firmicutes bacterium]|nr:hypothetical protein [Bacillota bacterium]